MLLGKLAEVIRETLRELFVQVLRVTRVDSATIVRDQFVLAL